MIHELRSPIPVETPQGRGWAVLYESDTTEAWWTVILNDTCAFMTFRQEKIRACRSYTYGRDMSDEDMRQIIGSGALPKKSPKSTLPSIKPRVRSRQRQDRRG